MILILNIILADAVGHEMRRFLTVLGFVGVACAASDAQAQSGLQSYDLEGYLTFSTQILSGMRRIEIKNEHLNLYWDRLIINYPDNSSYLPSLCGPIYEDNAQLLRCSTTNYAGGGEVAYYTKPANDPNPPYTSWTDGQRDAIYDDCPNPPPEGVDLLDTRCLSHFY